MRGEYSRDVDTEYKFFEYIYDKVLKGELKIKNQYFVSKKICVLVVIQCIMSL